jgi:type II secretion system protein G
MKLNSISGEKTPMKANKGFTLLEVAVVLAIIAILAAILTPVVTSYVDQARVTRANNDVKKIAQSVLLYKRDTGIYPGYDLLGSARISTSDDLKTCLVTGPSTSTTLTGWSCGTNVGFVEAYLNVNSVGLASTSVGNSTGGMVGFRGPYLDGLSGLDPWGNPYVVNSGNFVGSNKVFAISAGPNGTFDSSQSSTTPPAGTTDDLTSLIK